MIVCYQKMKFPTTRECCLKIILTQRMNIEHVRKAATLTYMSTEHFQYEGEALPYLLNWPVCLYLCLH